MGWYFVRLSVFSIEKADLDDEDENHADDDGDDENISPEDVMKRNEDDDDDDDDDDDFNDEEMNFGALDDDQETLTDQNTYQNTDGSWNKHGTIRIRGVLAIYHLQGVRKHLFFLNFILFGWLFLFCGHFTTIYQSL